MTAPDATAAPTTASPLDTVEALESGAVVRWWQVTTFVEVAGPDAPTLLDGLCTQAVERIEPGTAVLGLFLDAKAKIVAPALLHRTADATWIPPRGGDPVDAAPRLLLETTPELAGPLASHLSRYRLRSKATIESRELGTVALVGAAAARVAGELEPPAGGAWSRVLHQPRPTHAFVGDSDECSRLVTSLGAAGVPAADPDALEADRIDAGIAELFDLLAGRMPAEVGGMAHAVALDAGCYLGQEPVARLHYRGRANRTLRRLELDPARSIEPGEGGEPDDELALRRVGDDPTSRALGRLTTWARRPDGTTTALAVVRRELAAGEELQLPSGSGPLRVADDAPA